MAEEEVKIKSLKLKDSEDTRRPDLLKMPLTESPDRREKGRESSDKDVFKGKEPLKPVSRNSVRSSIGKNLVEVGEESNGREQEGKVATRIVKQDARVALKDEAKFPVKLLSKEEAVEKANGREQGNVNEREQGKELGNVNKKDSGGVRDLIRDRVRVKEKGKSPVVKSVFVKTRVKQGSAINAILKSKNAGASSSLGLSLQKKVMQNKTTTIIKTLKEKKVFSLPGQRHDPPEDRDSLRIFYSTLRDQVPESEMAEIWLMEYGLLPRDQAKKALERKQRRVLSKTSSRLSNGFLVVKKSLAVSNGKSKDIGTSSKGKKKREDSESDSDHELLRKARIKKKLKGIE